ncbi:MAG: glutathione S-transferase family protein [Casimicrobiaceae bacterium]
MSYELIIGNKKYSSWSLRPWLLMRAFGLAFTETRIPFDTPEFAVEIGSRKRSPNARVPVLVDGETIVWDSLAIAEYLAERHLGLWPADPLARAHARCACAEMHSGFPALRTWMPMCVHRRYPIAAPRTDVAADVARVSALWTEARERFGGRAPDGEPWLYGAFSVADAYYAPVVFRFQTYGVLLGGSAGEWMRAMLAHPAMLEWSAGAAAETEVVPHDEPEYLYGETRS